LDIKDVAEDRLHFHHRHVPDNLYTDSLCRRHEYKESSNNKLEPGIAEFTSRDTSGQKEIHYTTINENGEGSAECANPIVTLSPGFIRSINIGLQKNIKLGLISPSTSPISMRHTGLFKTRDGDKV
jgi:hypothetical protein